MGMSTHIIGFRPPDEKWKAMKDIYDSCKKAGVEVPKEVEKFFNHDAPDDEGIRVNLNGAAGADSVKAWSDDYRDGFEVDLENLRLTHPELTKIRFYNSW